MTRPSLHMPNVNPNMNPNTANSGYSRGSRATAEDNTQPRFELFLLGEGEKKVTEEADTREFSSLSQSKVANPCCFYIGFSITANDLLYLQQIPKPVPFRLQPTLFSLNDGFLC